MINNFISLYKPINTVISISRNKAFKDKGLLVTEDEIKYLKYLLKLQISYKEINILLYVILYL